MELRKLVKLNLVPVVIILLLSDQRVATSQNRASSTTSGPWIGSHGAVNEGFARRSSSSAALPFYAKYGRCRSSGSSNSRSSHGHQKAQKRIIQLHNNTGVIGRTKYLLETMFGVLGAILLSIEFIIYPIVDYTYSWVTIATNDTVNLHIGRQDTFGGGGAYMEDQNEFRYLIVDNLAVPINDCLEYAICLAANQVTGRFESAILDGLMEIFSGKAGPMNRVWNAYRQNATDRLFTTDAAVACDQFVCRPFRYFVKLVIYGLDWNSFIKQTV